MARCSVAMVALLILSSQTPGQSNRYELGLRLRAFEAEWENQPEAARKRAVKPLNQATGAFLFGQTVEAGLHLDRARRALHSDRAPAPATVWAESCALRPARRLIDAKTESLTLTLDRFYATREQLPADITLSLALGKLKEKGHKVEQLPLKVSLAVGVSGEGDYVLTGILRQKEKPLLSVQQTISVVANLDTRLKKLQKGVAALSKETRTTDAETVRGLSQLLGQLADGETAETDHPAARLMRDAEEMLHALAAGKAYHGPQRTGSFWLWLPGKEGTVPARVQVPEAAKEGKPLPLVIALHGAGGSENLFFDGYGRGLITQLCAKRGWLLVAPRNGLAPSVLEEIERVYPVDKKRIFLIGHSLGAAQVVAAASREPARFAGVAALGGGGGIKASEELKKIGFMVAVGSDDFLLFAARLLRDRLKKAEVKRLRYKEFADTEHLVIVRLALPEVFAFFDEIAKR